MSITLLAVLVLGFAAAVQMATGFGFALVSVPILAVLVGAHDAVVLALVAGTVFNAWQAFEGRGHRDCAVVARLLGGAALGLPVGYLIFRWIDPDTLTLLIGVLVLTAAGALARGVTLSSRSPVADLFVGACTGLLTTSTGTNGPPLVTLLQARRLSPREFRATVTAIFFALDLLGTALFAVGGEFTGSVLTVAAWSVPGLAAGGLAGHHLRALLGPRRFRGVVLALLFLAGGAAVAAALI